MGIPEEAWWHAPWFVEILLLLMTAMFACIGYFFKEWRKDRVVLMELKQKMEDLHNGTTIAEMRTRQAAIYDWWINHVKRQDK